MYLVPNIYCNGITNSICCGQICRLDAARVLATERRPPHQAAEGGRRGAGHGGGLGLGEGAVLGLQPAHDAAQPPEKRGVDGTDRGAAAGAQGGAQVKLSISDCDTNEVIGRREIHKDTIVEIEYIVLVNNAQV